jgi:hypothetical protein
MDVRARGDSRSDAELVAAAMAGDRGAFAAIYDRYADRLHDFCWSLLRDRDEAADATERSSRITVPSDPIASGIPWSW